MTLSHLTDNIFVGIEALMLAAYLALAWMAARERPP